MFSKKFSIAISDPCQEDWDKMTNSQEGKFCQSCQKNVIDFSNKTEKEIYQILKNTNGNMCGKFNALQLDTTLVVDTKPKWLQYLLKMKVAFITILTFFTSFPSKILHAKAATYITSEKKNIQNKEKILLEDEKEKIIAGKVVKHNTPVANIEVKIRIVYQDTTFQEEEYTIITDDEGKFSKKLILKSSNYTIDLYAEDFNPYYKGQYHLEAKKSSENILIELIKPYRLMGAIKYVPK